MLLKFANKDLFNSAVIDCASGAVAYRVSTSVPGDKRPRRRFSLYSYVSSYPQKRSPRVLPPRSITSLSLPDGKVAAEIQWTEDRVTRIQIGEETLAGNQELFDATFVRSL